LKIKIPGIARAILITLVAAAPGIATAQQIEGLPDEAPRQGLVITVDVSTNHAYLFEDGELIADGPAATGTEKILVHGNDMWIFHTPRGHMTVLSKIKDPIWTKPDWAFIEAGERVPPPDSAKRQERGIMGKYALSLGDGIYIHGTDDPSSLGHDASHGCIRLPAKLIAKIWSMAKIGTDVYVYDSVPPPMSAARELEQRELDHPMQNR